MRKASVEGTNTELKFTSKGVIALELRVSSFLNETDKAQGSIILKETIYIKSGKQRQLNSQKRLSS